MQGVYTIRHNARHRLRGHLFQGRYKAVLVEGGFMSHPYEARLIANPKYITAVARGISDAVTLYQKAVSYRKPAAAPVRKP
jgi:N-acetylmuramoyl-L-alanine amidase